MSGEDANEVRDALRAALAEIGVEPPSTTTALTVVFGDLSRRCLAGRLSERSVVGEVERIFIDSNYSAAVTDQPLGATYGLDDEWGAGWGRTEAELIAEVRSACRQQLRS